MCRNKKQNADKRWLQKAASEMDIELDETELYPLCSFCGAFCSVGTRCRQNYMVHMFYDEY